VHIFEYFHENGKKLLENPADITHCQKDIYKLLIKHNAHNCH